MYKNKATKWSLVPTTNAIDSKWQTGMFTAPQDATQTCLLDCPWQVSDDWTKNEKQEFCVYFLALYEVLPILSNTKGGMVKKSCTEVSCEPCMDLLGPAPVVLLCSALWTVFNGKRPFYLHFVKFIRNSSCWTLTLLGLGNNKLTHTDSGIYAESWGFESCSFDSNASPVTLEGPVLALFMD